MGFRYGFWKSNDLYGGWIRKVGGCARNCHEKGILKGKGITDSPFTKRLEPEIKLFRFEKSDIDYMDRTQEEKEEAAVNIKNGLNFARKVLTTGECNLLILDEVLEVVNKNIISVDDLRELVESRADTDIIITGSEMNVEVCKFADKISEIGNMQFRNF